MTEWEQRKEHINSDPERQAAYKKRTREAQARYRGKVAADPDKSAEHRHDKKIRARKYAAKISTDPIKMAKVREERNKKNKRYYDENESRRRRVRYRANAKINGYIQGARIRNYDWMLTVESATVLMKSPCHYCGRQGADYGLNGIDRKDNDEGYTIGNTLPCCSMCNMGKGTKTYEQTQEWLKAIVNHNKQMLIQ